MPPLTAPSFVGPLPQMRAGVFRYSPTLLINGTEAELGPWTGQTGRAGTEKCPVTGLNRRSDIRHGSGHARVRPGYRRIDAPLRQRVQPTALKQPAGPMARARAHQPLPTPRAERERRSRARSESAGRRPTSNSARIHQPAWAAEEVRQKSCRFRARTRTGFVSVSRAAAVPPRRYSMPQLRHTRLALGHFAPPP
jgi:hypothetical protein